MYQLNFYAELKTSALNNKVVQHKMHSFKPHRKEKKKKQQIKQNESSCTVWRVIERIVAQLKTAIMNAENRRKENV